MVGCFIDLDVCFVNNYSLDFTCSISCTDGLDEAQAKYLHDVLEDQLKYPRPEELDVSN